MHKFMLREATDRINRAERAVIEARTSGSAEELAFAEDEAGAAAKNYAEVSCFVDSHA